MPKIVFNLPDGVPEPKFKLFQTVYHSKQQGRIIGMIYTSAIEALALNESTYGWEYHLSYVFGKSPEEAISADERDSYIHEEKLSAAGE
jgi:hypothetical protein